jgi:hypothetical protein
MSKVAERMQVAGQSFEATQEYARIGAITGVVTYADGSQLNLFDAFGINNGSPPAEIDFNLDAANPTPGTFRQQCTAVIRTLSTNLGGLPIAGVEALVGDAFFDAMIMLAEIRATYLNTAEAAELRQGYIQANGLIYSSFVFGGINWINYRGIVNGTSFINTDKAYFYPIGVPGLFRTVYAPADYIETVNTMGRPRYVKQYEMQNGKGIHLDTQMNALNYCTRPGALLRGKRT